jgi:hypothetical protein
MLNRLVLFAVITFALFTGVIHAQPAAPQLKTATAADKAVQLAWTAVPGATYKIYWRTTTGVTIASAAGHANNSGVAFTVPSLTNDTAYFFVVTAVDAGGESAPSNELSATPVAQAAVASKTTLTTPTQPTSNVGQSPDTNIQTPTMTYSPLVPANYPVVALAGGVPNGKIIYENSGVEKLIQDACAPAFKSVPDFTATFNDGETYTIINVINLKGGAEAQNVVSNNWYLYSKDKTFKAGFAGGWQLSDFDGATRLYGSKKVLLLSILENNMTPAVKDTRPSLTKPSNTGTFHLLCPSKKRAHYSSTPPPIQSRRHRSTRRISSRWQTSILILSTWRITNSISSLASSAALP